MTIYEKLSTIQSELKAPKGQYNNFGKYKYRSCEDILEAVKKICRENKAVLVLSDELVCSGSTHENIHEERFYIKAEATLYDLESENKISNTAYAREEKEKKGMDGSQITGTASSYARKYALNGLFNIDDTKDADTDEFKKQLNVTDKQKEMIKNLYETNEIKKELEKLNRKKLSDLSITEASNLIKGKKNE